ncbi:hypothetical protein TKK_0019041 [Trichogramma kaykai]
MQFSQDQDASEFEVDVEFQNENENQTYRDFLHSKFTQLKMLYKTNRKYFFIGFVIVMLVIIDIINVSLKINPTKSNSLDATNQVDLINKDSRNKAEYEMAFTKKELKFEFFTTETSMITKHQSASTDFDRYTQKTEFNNSLLLFEGKSLWLLNLDNEHRYHWHESNNYVSAFYFNFKGEPIWFEDQSNTTHSLADEYNGLSLPPNLKVKAIVDDFATGDSYALDEEGENLLIFDQNFHYSAVIVSDLKNATDLKIDPFTRLIFILADGEILRCTMDGKSLRTLKFLKKDINSFALDYTSKQIYLLDESVIEYSDYEGKVRTIFHKFETFDQVSSLIYQYDRLFWVQKDVRLSSKSLRYITYCQVNEKCLNTSKIPVLSKQSKIIAFPNKSVLTFDKNPCQQIPSVCDHICILGANNTYACTCDQFHQLEDDMKTCRLVKDYLIYFIKNSFRGKFFHNSLSSFNSSSNELIPFLPVHFDYEVNGYLNTVFGKGSEDFEIFVSDSNIMYSINIRNAEQRIVFNVQENQEIISFIYDPEVNCLYLLLRDIYKNYYVTTWNENTKMMSPEVYYEQIYSHVISSMAILSYNKYLLLNHLGAHRILQFQSLTNAQDQTFEIDRDHYSNIILLQKNPFDLDSRKLNWLSFEDNNVSWRWGSKFDNCFTVESTITLPSVLSNVDKGFVYEENLYAADSHTIWRVQKNSSINADILFKITEDIRGITFILS